MKLSYKILSIALLLFIWACDIITQNHSRKNNIENEHQALQIGISKAKGSKGYLQYGKWLRKLDSSIVYYDLYHIPLDSALAILQHCDGLIVSGGPDVDPSRYNQIEDTTLCETIDYKRDSLEYALLDLALSQNMPILGICRGEQIINVYMGGSLFPDIPTAKPNNIGHRFNNFDSSHHSINILNNSLLSEIAQHNDGVVNSSHHQAVDRLAKNLVILARTNDSIVEAITWKNPDNKGFLLGVQWHPEWLKIDNPFSGKIGYRYLKEARKYKSYKN